MRHVQFQERRCCGRYESHAPGVLLVTAQAVIDALRAALAASPYDDAIRRHLADLLVADGYAEDALVLYEESLRSHPDDAELNQAAALAARLCGRSDAAELHDRVAARSNDADPGAGFAITGAGGGVGTERDGAPGLTLEDVGGLDQVKAKLTAAFLGPATDPGLSAYYGKSLRGGLMLYGPPGCGKTYIARALAGELGARFHPVGINDVLDMWLGESERKLHELFETARDDRPAMLFLDEVDALGRKRSQIQGAGRTAVSQLLIELDGVSAGNEGLFVLAATNHPWDVDTALRRPGRLDRMVFVPPPNATDRAQILALHLRERPTRNLDLVTLSATLDRFSGADLAQLCEGAAELAIEHAIRTGDRRPISQDQLVKASNGIKPSTIPWFEVAQNVARFAAQGGEYDEMLAYLRREGML
jgi:AAA+ superfamily predicted ATPase